ncbi:MAG: hypothetical protein JRH10_22400 [Deltaproteobacteria bacterium]|nr:hypothetical protein [Deltaproteobacteria bacterium]
MEGALLVDMDGRVLHEWNYPSQEAFDGSTGAAAQRRQWWRRAHLFPNGDVLAIVSRSGLLKVDRDSNLLWALDIHAHHDLAIAPNRDLYLLGREVGIVPRVNAEEPIVEDLVVVLDADGNEKRRFSLLEAFERSSYVDAWRSTGRVRGDILHTNSIEWLDGRISSRNPAFAEGNLLISARGLDAIAVVDPVAEKVVWAHTGSYRRQHDPKILSNGNLLLFDNHGAGPSAILEFEPGGMEIVWEFRGDETQPFYSESCGTSERLPNGNTLISETDFGRALEVTRAGEIVWEFYNPHRAGDEDQFIATIPELVRLPADFPSDWLDDSARR